LSSILNELSFPLGKMISISEDYVSPCTGRKDILS
jgi:hypothetical protein